MDKNEITKLYEKAEKKGEKLFMQILINDFDKNNKFNNNYIVEFTETTSSEDVIIYTDKVVYLVEIKTRKENRHYTDIVELSKIKRIQKKKFDIEKLTGKPVEILFCNFFENDNKYRIYNITNRIDDTKERIDTKRMEKTHLQSHGKVDKKVLEYHRFFDKAITSKIYK